MFIYAQSLRQLKTVLAQHAKLPMPCEAAWQFSCHSHTCSVAAASVQYLQLQHRAQPLVSM